MERQIVIHPYSAISHGHNKELATDRCNSIDALQQHFAKLKKPDSKNYKLYDFMCMIYQKGNTMETETSSVMAKGWRCKETDFKGT